MLRDTIRTIFNRKGLSFVFGVFITVIFFKITTPIARNEFALSRECVDWSKLSADVMTGRQIIDYLKWTNQTSCEISNYFGGHTAAYPVKLFPGVEGQKAVCIDDGIEPDSRGCVVYSFGINNEWSFDEAMEKYGCNVFAFDPSMNKNDHKHSERIFFYNMGLGHQDYIRSGSGWNMKTLSSIYEMLQPKHGKTIIDYLKIDIEGDEWDVISNIIASGMLPRIRQMGVEVHLWPANGTISHFRNLIRILQSLEANGMVRFNSVINPTTFTDFDDFGFSDYMCYEIAWYNSYL